MDSDPRVIRERGDNDAIREAARAWINGDFTKAGDICRTLRDDGVHDPEGRMQQAIDRMRGDA